MYRIDFIPTKRRARSKKIGDFVSYYDHPQNVIEAAEIRATYTGEKYDCPVMLIVDTYGKLPKGTPKRIESEANTIKPDIDNTVKAIMDALNGYAYTDDRLITCIIATKHPRVRREKEYTLFEVIRAQD